MARKKKDVALTPAGLAHGSVGVSWSRSRAAF